MNKNVLNNRQTHLLNTWVEKNIDRFQGLPDADLLAAANAENPFIVTIWNILTSCKSVGIERISPAAAKRAAKEVDRVVTRVEFTALLDLVIALRLTHNRIPGNAFIEMPRELLHLFPVIDVKAPEQKDLLKPVD